MITRRQTLIGCASLGATQLLPARAMANTKLHVPAEDAPHELTFMQWPNSREVYRDAYFLDQVQETIAEIANTIAEFEPVIMLADQALHTNMREKLSKSVELWDIPTEDLWARDSGPIFARTTDGSLAMSHIQFNGWGEKQVNLHDSQIAKRVAERLDVPLKPAGLRGEGGGVDHDGENLIIAHESSWVNDNRNRGLSRGEVERRLRAAYGTKNVIWSTGVYREDITDFHIDALARFTAPGRILINLPNESNPQDPFHTASLETHDVLVRAGLEVDVIPEPDFRRVKSLDFVASYVNYYVCNGAVITAQFGDKGTDAEAVAALKRHYPDREIIALNVDRLGEFGGGIHCATQQMPKV